MTGRAKRAAIARLRHLSVLGTQLQSGVQLGHANPAWRHPGSQV